MVEVPMSDVVAKLKLADTAQIVVLDVDGQQVPYQVTYDEKVVFPVTVGETVRLLIPFNRAHRHLLMSLLAVNTTPNVWTTLPGRIILADSVLMVLLCRLVENVVLAMIFYEV